MTTYYVRNSDRSKAIDASSVTDLRVNHYRSLGESQLIVKSPFGNHDFRFSTSNHVDDAEQAAKDITYHMNKGKQTEGSDRTEVRLTAAERDVKDLRLEVRMLRQTIAGLQDALLKAL